MIQIQKIHINLYSFVYIYSRMKITVHIFTLSLLTLTLTQICHNSCSTCSGPSYTQCLTCSDTTHSIQYGVSCDGNDQSILTQIGGLCINSAYTRTNPLGAVLLVISITAGIFIKSQYVFYFILTIQTFGLLEFVQTAFPFGISTLLGSFDYLMIFSIMQQNTKIQTCKLMLRGMYHMNDYLGTTQFKDNSLPLFIIGFILMSLLVLGTILRAFHKNNCYFLTEKTLDYILLGLRTSLLLMMQQTILILYIGIRFSTLNGGLIFMILLYCIGLVYLIVDCNLHQLPYFKSIELMNITFIKRLILPALVSIPYKYSYSLIIFMIGFNLIEILFLSKVINLKPKAYLYRLLELICLCLIGGFTITDLSNNNFNQSTSISIFVIISFVLYILVFIYQIVIGFKKKLQKGKISNQNEQWNISKQFSDKQSIREQDTVSDINNQEDQNKQYAKNKAKNLRRKHKEQKIIIQELE